MEYKYNDGGREQAGFKGTPGDCVVRAITIATGKPYIEVYNDLATKNATFAEEKRCRVAKVLQKRGASPRNGNFKRVYHDYILSLGMKWNTCMRIGSGCKVHLKAEELPTGRIICRVSKHLVAVIDGVIQDTYDCSRDGSRCVYGYYSY